MSQKKFLTRDDGSEEGNQVGPGEGMRLGLALGSDDGTADGDDVGSVEGGREGTALG